MLYHVKMDYIGAWKKYIFIAGRCLLRPYTMALKHSDEIYTSEQLIPKAGYNRQQHS